MNQGRPNLDPIATERTKSKYKRIARFYDTFEGPMERRFNARFRRLLFERVNARRILELGVGTGKNLPFYSAEAEITAIDLTPQMLEQAKRKNLELKKNVIFLEMDAQALDLPNESFDVVLATFVFCSVPNPVLGLAEAHRVCKPDGKLLLVEHMRPERWFMGRMFDLFNPAVKGLLGLEINRRTLMNIELAGWRIVTVRNLLSDIVKFVEATPQ